MGQRLILSEQEKKNIQEMYGLISEQGVDKNEVDKDIHNKIKKNIPNTKIQ